MSVKDSIFGSNGEKRGYQTIKRSWGDKYEVHSQLPWSQLFDIGPEWRGTKPFFYQTSVDYVICYANGFPLLAIDFDGLGRGYDSRGRYVQGEATKDRYRKKKFDIKLECARANKFPYHIVSYEEFTPFDDSHLTVIDEIISYDLSLHDWMYQDLSDPSMVRDQDEMHWRHSKVFQETGKVRRHVHSITGTGSYRKSLSSARGIDGGPGAVATFYDTPVGEVSELCQLRDVGYASGAMAFDIAELMVWRKLLRLLRRA